MSKKAKKPSGGNAAAFRPLTVGKTVSVLYKDGSDTDIIREWNGSEPAYQAADFFLRRGIEHANAERIQDALDDFKEAARLCPTLSKTHLTAGFALMWHHEIRAAELCFREAIRLSPGDVEAHFHLALCCLEQGNFADGWAEYEWRTGRRPPIVSQQCLEKPRWRGEPLAGKTLLIHSEQGSGDFLQISRYIPLVWERYQPEKIILGCAGAVERVARTLPCPLKTVLMNLVSGDVRGGVPNCDVQIPLMSLPLLFETGVDTIPANVPYVFADPAEAEAWKAQLAALPGFKVGIVWAGSATHANDKHRSMHLRDFAPLAALDGVTLFSLQKGLPAAQVADYPELVPWVPVLDDFADTAALMTMLDLIISVDTGAAHLAGALGIPVWTLLSHGGEWRWLQNRTDSPWYPTMRLFRQSTPGDWAGLMAQVAVALRANITQKRTYNEGTAGQM